MWPHLLPPVPQFTAQKAWWWLGSVPRLLPGFSGGGHQDQQPAWLAGVKGQGAGAPAENYLADEPKDSQVPRGHDLWSWQSQQLPHPLWGLRRVRCGISDRSAESILRDSAMPFVCWAPFLHFWSPLLGGGPGDRQGVECGLCKEPAHLQGETVLSSEFCF